MYHGSYSFGVFCAQACSALMADLLSLSSDRLKSNSSISWGIKSGPDWPSSCGITGFSGCVIPELGKVSGPSPVNFETSSFRPPALRSPISYIFLGMSRVSVFAPLGPRSSADRVRAAHLACRSCESFGFPQRIRADKAP